MGKGIKLLQSDLIPFPKEQIDISLIWFSDGLHRDVLVGTSLFIVFKDTVMEE